MQQEELAAAKRVEENSRDEALNKYEVLNKAFDNQKYELEIQAEIINNKIKEIESNERIATASIQAQAELHVHSIKAQSQAVISRYIFIFLCLVVLLMFSFLAIKLAAQAILVEILKYSVPLVGVGVGGYYYGKFTRHNNPDRDD